MKRNIAILACTVLAAVAGAQQFIQHTNEVVVTQPSVWSGTNARVLGDQLLSLTNADGSRVFPAGLAWSRNTTIVIKVQAGADGVQSIRALVR